MKDFKHLIELSSDWLFGQIQTRIIGTVFIIASTLEIVNRFDLSVLFTNPNVSRAMDIAWLVDFIFTVIAAVNWLFRKLWESR